MQTKYKNAYVLNVMSDDHPGIVAAVGQAVQDMSGNIDTCSQTVLAGYFTLIMIVSFPRPADEEKLAGIIRGPEGERRGFQVIIRKFNPKLENRGAKPNLQRFVVTATGKDKPGIVQLFSQYLAGKDINIIDFYGARQDEDFILISQVEVPETQNVSMLQADMEELGKQESFVVRFQHENIFVATNQLRMGGYNPS